MDGTTWRSWAGIVREELKLDQVFGVLAQMNVVETTPFVAVGRHLELPTQAAGVASISLTTLVGSGTGSPNSRRARRCPEIASRMFRSVSSKVRPVLMHPGRSGTYAAQFVSACSKITDSFLSNPAAFKIDFKVPVGNSSPRCPGMVTILDLTGCNGDGSPLSAHAANHPLTPAGSHREPSSYDSTLVWC